MHIHKLQITSFKGFENEVEILFNTPNGSPGSGLNIFVGENNTGKSTAFEAIEFVRNGTKKEPSSIRSKGKDIEAKVEITFRGEINDVVESFSQDNKKEVFKKYIYQDEGAKKLRISRGTEDLKIVSLWNEELQKYENPTGIDAPLKKLFEANFVWADTNPNDEASFGATTICGNLLKEIISNFTETTQYDEFKKKFHEIFNDQNSSLKKEVARIEQRLEDVFSELFGSAKINFHFEELKIDSYFKNTTIEVDDGVSTPMGEKGNGMQRAVALALLQVYSEKLIENPNPIAMLKPFFLFIDEPEICLHPNAQTKLLGALLEISKSKQVFLSTHSPYFLSAKELRNMGLHVFTKNSTSNVVRPASSRPLLPWSPTWGEINYLAYGMPTVEFHNELYGYLQELSGKHWQAEFDGWLLEHGIMLSKEWIKVVNKSQKSSEQVSLQTYIRNLIHHPENTIMREKSFSSNELHESIVGMIDVLGAIRVDAEKVQN